MNLRLQRAQLRLRYQTPRFQVAVLFQLLADHRRRTIQRLQVFTQISPAAAAPSQQPHTEDRPSPLRKAITASAP